MNMLSLVSGGPGDVAVDQDLSHDLQFGHAAAWTSPDGVRWGRVPHDPAVFGTPDDMTGMSEVVAGGPNLVAIGDGRDGADAAVRTWADGHNWRRIPHQQDVFGGATMSGVTLGGPGLVAVGFAGTWPLTAAVWTSPDGLAWTRVTGSDQTLSSPNGGWLYRVIAAGPGLVAVGADESAAAVWTSPDGRIWNRIDHALAGLADPSRSLGMVDVTDIGAGLVAVGYGYARREAQAVVMDPARPLSVRRSRLAVHERRAGRRPGADRGRR